MPGLRRLLLTYAIAFAVWLPVAIALESLDVRLGRFDGSSLAVGVAIAVAVIAADRLLGPVGRRRSPPAG